ncbi:MAG: hypothetical protein LC632_09535, partial [Xanthomonadaceae bacterium]|nr:hypothetical protein [Xanthomonadaceae bacterium]
KYAFYALLIAVLLGGVNDWVNAVDAVDYIDKPAWLRFVLMNLPLYFLLMTPVAVLALRLAFWKSPRNTVEITAFVLYMLGQTALVIVAVGFIVYLAPKAPAESPLNVLLVLIALAVPLFYGLYAVVGFFRSRLDHALIAALLAMGATLWIAGRLWFLLAY